MNQETLIIGGCGVLVGLTISCLYISNFARRLTRRGNNFPKSGIGALDHAISDLAETIQANELRSTTLIERYQVLTENLAAAVVIRDTEGRIMYCSPYTEVLTGFPLTEIYNETEDFLLLRVHPDDRGQYERSMSIPNVGEAFQFRYRFFHRNGLMMWAETRAVPIFDEGGNVVSTLSITLDVTANVRQLQQIEEKNKDLEEFTYMVSHDLKAPIYTIRGMVNILEEDFKANLPKEAQEVIDHATSATKRLESLVASVLQYAKLSSQEVPLVPVDLNVVMADIKNDFEHQITSAEGKLIIETRLPTVLGDRLRLYQIFSNLVGNAYKYRSPNRAPEIKIYRGTGTSDQEFVLLVSDNGLGIPSDKLEIIFRPFQRAHGDNIEGTGIGLAGVRKLLERCNARISVQSTVDQGSVFTIRFLKAS